MSNLADQESLDALRRPAIAPKKQTAPAAPHVCREAFMFLKGTPAALRFGRYDGDAQADDRVVKQEGQLVFADPEFPVPFSISMPMVISRARLRRRITSAPLYVISSFTARKFIYNNSVPLPHDRYRGGVGDFSEMGVEIAVSLPDVDRVAQRNRLNRIWETMFIRDVSRFDRLTQNRSTCTPTALSKSIHFRPFGKQPWRADIVESQSGFYTTGAPRRHGPGRASALSRPRRALFADLGRRQGSRYGVDWSPGIMLSPPDMWWAPALSAPGGSRRVSSRCAGA
jgi:hypothetical protein